MCGCIVFAGCARIVSGASGELLLSVVGCRQVDDRRGAVLGDDHDHVALGTQLAQGVVVLGREHLLVQPVLALGVGLGRDHLDLGLLAVDQLDVGRDGGAAADDLVGVGRGLGLGLGPLGRDLRLLELGTGLFDLLLGRDDLGDGLLGRRVQGDVAQVDLVEGHPVLAPRLLESQLDIRAQRGAFLLDGEGRVLGRSLANDVAQRRLEDRIGKRLLRTEVFVDVLDGSTIDVVGDRDTDAGVGATVQRCGDGCAILAVTAGVAVHLDGLVADVELLRGVPRCLELQSGVGGRGDHVAGEADLDGRDAFALGVEASEGEDGADDDGHHARDDQADASAPPRVTVVDTARAEPFRLAAEAPGHEESDDGEESEDHHDDDGSHLTSNLVVKV